MKSYPDLAGYETAREWLQHKLNYASPVAEVQFQRIADMLEAAAAVVHANTDEVSTTEGDDLCYFALERLEELMR